VQCNALSSDKGGFLPGKWRYTQSMVQNMAPRMSAILCWLRNEVINTLQPVQIALQTLLYQWISMLSLIYWQFTQELFAVQVILSLSIIRVENLARSTLRFLWLSNSFMVAQKGVYIASCCNCMRRKSFLPSWHWPPVLHYAFPKLSLWHRSDRTKYSKTCYSWESTKALKLCKLSSFAC